METEQRHGLIAKWDDDKGYGFIAPRGGGREVFVHIKAFPGGMRRPKVGDAVSYLHSKDAKARLQAVDARLTTVALESIAEMSRGGSRTLVFALCFIVLICLFAWKGYLPWFIPGIYAFSSLFAFLFYSFDKAAAQANQWRISESTLHGLSLIGGWPGALVGQAVYRHKTRKASFRSGFWATVLANCSALAVVAILASKT